jgi:glycosyltransferase involved in cell wall biosynthesis
MNGFYDLNDYGKLISATHIYVNVSHCEGLCMPLMEFMSCGKPAISPRHTAMEDYIDGSVAFIPHVSLERSTWPQDPRDLVRTLRYRLDWQTIYAAYQDSYRVARDAPEIYARMSEQAIEKLRDFCSKEVVKRQLAEFFGLQTTDQPIDMNILQAERDKK